MKFLKACVLDAKAVTAWNREPSKHYIVMLQGLLGCGVHDEYTVARGKSARPCEGSRRVMQNYFVRAMRCFFFNGKCQCI